MTDLLHSCLDFGVAEFFFHELASRHLLSALTDIRLGDAGRIRDYRGRPLGHVRYQLGYQFAERRTQVLLREFVNSGLQKDAITLPVPAKYPIPRSRHSRPSAAWFTAAELSTLKLIRALSQKDKWLDAALVFLLLGLVSCLCVVKPLWGLALILTHGALIWLFWDHVKAYARARLLE